MPDEERGEGRREQIVEAGRRVLATDPSASVADIAAAAGVSRATFYRWFPSRAALLDTLAIEPDPGTADRILGAAKVLLERDGLSRMSMDELAEAAGISRASVYRIYPGKAALFAALLVTESPYAAISAALRRMHDRPPDEVLPALLAIVEQVVRPHTGILRSIMFEVTAGTPEAVEAADKALRPMLADVTAYLAGQMEAGRIRRMHPLLAAQALMGPLVFHLVSRSVAGRLVGLDVEPAAAAQTFAAIALRGLAPEPPEE